MFTWIKSHLLAVSVAGVAVVAGLAWLAFGWFGIHTAFIDREVDEALPTFDRAVEAAPPDDTTAPEPPRPDTTGPAPEPDTTEPDTTEPDTAAEPDTTEPDTAAEPETTEQEPAPEPDPAPEPEIVVEASGAFESIGRYTTVGEAIVLGDGSGQRFVRFEDFETSNGPDLNVYLVNSSTGDVSDYVDLGDLRGNIGSQNYEIPAGVDLDVYDTVMIWCVRFSTGFGQATLSTSAA